jgi:hypothetical protein
LAFFLFLRLANGGKLASFSVLPMRLEPAQMSVDLNQGSRTPGMCMVAVPTDRNSGSNACMPPLHKFKKFDVRPLLQKGREPLPEITKRVARLKEDEGLIIVAPFLPSPLIEKLGGEGFDSKLEPGQGGQWIVYFWRHT